MNRFAVREEDDPEIAFSGLLHLDPAPKSTIGLDLFPQRTVSCPLNPRVFDGRPIRPSLHRVEVRSRLHAVTRPATNLEGGTRRLNFRAGDGTTTMIGESLSTQTLGSKPVDLPGFAQLAARSTISRSAPFVMHPSHPDQIGLTCRAQPRAARERCFGLAFWRARRVGCSALLAGGCRATLLRGRRAGTPLSRPSALRSSSTSGQCTPWPSPISCQFAR